jgi:hypothetical protein
MPRGRQYYDPIVQVPGTVEGEQDLSRIELFPEGSPEDANPKWRGRLIDAKGLVASVTSGDFNQERALEQAKQTFGEHLSVYVLRDEGQDSTWEGHGPSPRLWQRPGATPTEIPPAVPPFDLKVDQEGQEEIWRPTEEQAPLRLLVAPEPGPYALLSDILGLLEMWAVSYEVDKNPSGALALRDAVDMLRDIG